MCIAYNKKNYPNIKFDGGPDLCQPTVENKLIEPDLLHMKKLLFGIMKQCLGQKK